MTLIMKEFCDMVRARSNEHRLAVEALATERIYSQIVSILRQELDSMIRVINLLAITDPAKREKIVKTLIDEDRWVDADGKKMTDGKMLELASELHGWTRSVYRFGCGFIHLSRLHSYREKDPLLALSEEERKDILRHMRAYHGGPTRDDCSIEDLFPYLPRVFEKIAGNLECYVKALEEGRGLEP